MAIEFRCSQCGSLLRVPDETAGKMAKCPTCNQVLPIPNASTAAAPAMPAPTAGTAAPGGSPFASPTQPSFAPASDNPYQSPGAYVASAGLGGELPKYPIVPTKIDVGEVLSAAWALFKDQAGMCVLAFIIVIAVAMGIGMVVGLVMLPLTVVVGQDSVGAVAIQLIMQLVQQLIQLWFVLGQYQFYMRIARGGEARIADLFSGSRQYLSALIVSVIWLSAFIALALPAVVVAMVSRDENIALATGGFTVLIAFIPAVIVGLGLSQTIRAIVDRDLGPIEAFRMSWTIMTGNKLNVFVLFVVALAVQILGCLALCVGILAAIPFNMLMMMVAYLQMTGQPLPRQAMPQQAT